MSSFVSAFTVTGGIIAAIGLTYMVYVGGRAAWKLASFTFKFIEYKLDEKRKSDVKEYRDRAQREADEQARLYAGLLLGKLPELIKWREVALNAPYDHASNRTARANNQKRARALTKIRALVKSNWTITGADTMYRDEVLKQLRTSWGVSHESC